MNLFIEIKSQDFDSNIELVNCLNSNINNPIIKKIYIFSDNKDLNIKHDKVVVIENNNTTFKDYFSYINNNINKGDICIISNSDIHFNDTLSNINSLNIEGKFYALNKWVNGNVNPTISSQDTWIFSSPVSIKNCDFQPFIMGGDNRITYLANEADYIVTNPCGQVVTNSLGINERSKETIKGRHCYVKLTRDVNTISPNVIKSI